MSLRTAFLVLASAIALGGLAQQTIYDEARVPFKREMYGGSCFMAMAGASTSITPSTAPP